MSGSSPQTLTPPPATKLRRPRFQLVWLIPVVAAVIAGYLGYRTIIEQGPLLTLTFNSADGVTAGETQLKYKAVALGTVESIDLAPDNSHVIVKVRMSNVGARFLTSHARYWVVKPRFNVADVSGIETLISGGYITVDPGRPGGSYQNSFTGLEEPPGVRSDEPGSTYILTADSVGSFSSGSPIFYRDVPVGEVLGYDIGDGLGQVKLSIFIRAPFDKLVRPDSRFWNTSGIALGVRGGVLQLQLQSIQALLAGGIVLTLPDSARGEDASPDHSTFPLYPSQQAAFAASFARQLKLATYFSGDVSGLTSGSPVVIQGIQIGVVSAVTLELDRAHGTTRVRVDMNVQPGRIDRSTAKLSAEDSAAVIRRLVQNDVRAQLGTESYITGQKLIIFGTVPDAAPAEVTSSGDTLIVPSAPGGLDQTIAAVNQLANNLNKIPFKQIGDNLNKLLVTANGTLGGPQMKQLLQQLSQTLTTANTTLTMLNQGFGTDSDFQRGLQQLLQQTTATEQSVKTLSDYVNQHPQALLLGRSGK
jgi:paraquat-inducible protein B